MAIKQVQKGPSPVTAGDTQQLTLTITVGDPQIGGNVVQLNGVPIAKGEIAGLPIGTGSTLRGKMMTIYTNVLDVNANSNNISITHQFDGAATPTFLYKDIVDSDGDIYSLTAV